MVDKSIYFNVLKLYLCFFQIYQVPIEIKTQFEMHQIHRMLWRTDALLNSAQLAQDVDLHIKR